MAKVRSPNYPQLTLAEAIEKVRRVYAAEHMHPAAKEVIVQDMGYSGVHGASAVILGALNRYGLLEAAGDGLRVSNLAVAILELPEEDANHKAALRAAALNPGLFAALNRQFGNKLPSEGSLRHSLIKQGFLPKAADDVVRIYRDNLNVISLDSSEYNDDVTATNQRAESGSKEIIKQQPTWPTVKTAPRAEGPQFASFPTLRGEPSDTRDNELRFRLSPKSGVRIFFDGSVTQQAIDKLVALLNLSRDAFPVGEGIEAASEVVDAEPVGKEPIG